MFLANAAETGAGRSTFDPVAKLIELAGPKPRVVVAFSGGVDSTVLAHAAGQAAPQARRPAAAARRSRPAGRERASGAGIARSWRATGACRSSSLRARIERRRGESPEAAARDARYAVARERDAAGRSAGHRPASRRPGRNAAAAVVPRRRCRRARRACRRSRLRRPAASRVRCSTSRARKSKPCARAGAPATGSKIPPTPTRASRAIFCAIE